MKDYDIPWAPVIITGVICLLACFFFVVITRGSPAEQCLDRGGKVYVNGATAFCSVNNNIVEVWKP